MTAILGFLGRTTGVPINFVMLLGTTFGHEPGASAWMLGMILLLAGGGLVALVYGWGFEATGRGGYRTGLWFGSVHAIVAGLLLGALPAVHRQVSDGIEAPGLFFSNLGAAGVAAFLAIYLVYGAIVGAFYGRPLRTGGRRLRTRP